MLGFALRRLAWTLVVLVAISVMTFLIFFATPGSDPARRLAGRSADPATIALVRHEYGLDRPLPIRYLNMMDHLFVKRDIVSYSSGRESVIPQLLHAAPVTLSLVAGATVLWLLFSLGIGVLATLTRSRMLDGALMGFCLVLVCLPTFWLAEMANLITQDRFHDFFLFSWIPAPGYVSIGTDPLAWFEHLVVPWITLATLYVGLYARVLRERLRESEQEDYVRTAVAKGVPRRRIVLVHALRNSLLTFVSLFGLDFGALIGGGALVTEVIFSLPGVGALSYQALTDLDLPVIMATVTYAAFFVVLSNAAVDVLYAALDPRTRTPRTGFA